ncbi:MAG: T9SS type A sorting domain-containing protein [Lewinellaceae bacterium]|nr:T9SS type A sorting domain-containing protein [Lewinellaceae bacterium]
MGVKLTPGADLIVQMHYPKGVTGLSDMTTLNFFFTPSSQGIREIQLAPLLNHTFLSLENFPLNIPANTVKTYHAKFKTPLNGSVISVAPHMHLIGRNIVSFAVTPQNDTIPLIRINEWDFHWQGAYYFQKLQKIPAQSTLHAYATYDNTLDNPNQPSDPPQLVTQGEATTDEMMLVYFAFTAYQPGDEDIVLDSTLLTTAVPFVGQPDAAAMLSVFPNPANDRATIEVDLASMTDIQISISDMRGRTVRQFAEKRDLAPGIFRESADLTGIPPGVYVVKAHSTDGSIMTAKIVKQ